MIGIDAIYRINGIELRGQFIYNNISNSAAYNAFGQTNMGSAMMGYYLEAGYNVFQHTKMKSQLIPFVRFEHYDTQYQMANDLAKTDANSRTEITAGLGWKITPGTVLKADYQKVTSADKTAGPKYLLNMGVGVWF